MRIWGHIIMQGQHALARPYLTRWPPPKTNAPAKGDTKTGAGFEGMSTGNSENPMCKEDNNP